jgi:hypothetical protein
MALLGALLLGEMLVLWAGQRMLYAPLRGRLGKWPSYLIDMPGTVLHEISHYIACKILFVPTGRVVLFHPEEGEDGSITFGYVEHAESDPLRGALVAVAPAILVPLAMWGLLSLLWGQNIFQNPQEMITGFSLGEIWKIPLSLYLLLAARGAFPSPGDHVGFVGGVALLLLLGAAVYFLPLLWILEALRFLALLLLLPAFVSLSLLVLLRWGSGGPRSG